MMESEMEPPNTDYDEEQHPNATMMESEMEPPNTDYDEEQHPNDGDMRTTPMSPLETSAVDGGAQFSEDMAGARVMRDHVDDNRQAFVRFRRWRNIVLAGTLVLAAIVVVAFSVGRESVMESSTYQDGLSSEHQDNQGSGKWKLIDHVLTQPDHLSAMERRQYVNFGYKVKMDVDGNHFAVAKQGVSSEIGGGIEVYSHWGPDFRYYPNEWFHAYTLKIPAAAGLTSGPPHTHQSVDMSEDGHRIVFNQGNEIHVYFMEGKNVNYKWDPLGSPIELPSNHEQATTVFGHEVAISGDGFYIAVLGYSTTMSEKAFVDIFHYSFTINGAQLNDQWTLVKEITLQSYMGGTVAFDTFGKRLVVGETSPTRISVHDRLGDEDLTIWNEHQDAMGSASSLEKLGSVVSLSNDGMRLAFGTQNGEGNFVAVLQAKEEGNDVVWEPLGRVHQTAATHMKFGASVQLSFDGKRLVVGAPGTPDIQGDPALEQYRYGRIYLYEYDESIGEWTEVLSPKISSERGDALGTSVTLDQYGSIVGAGAPLRDPVQGVSAGGAVAYAIHVE